jgi:protein SCO1/2
MLFKKNRYLFPMILIVIAFIVCFMMVGNPFKKAMDAQHFHGTLLDKPRAIKPFKLMGIDEKPFTQQALKGQWTMIFFGFTRCGSMCPTTMGTLGKMYRLLNAQQITPLPQVVMISIDPKHDSLEKLNQYVKAFNPHFYGATGDEASIQALTQELGIAYFNVTRKITSSTTYDDIEHTGALLLFNPQGKLAAFFTTPHQADLLADDYRLLIN